MVSKRVDTLFVTDANKHLIGYLNVESFTSPQRNRQSIDEVMQREVAYVKTGTKLQDSVRRILKRNLQNIPVVDEDKRLIGLITRANIVDTIYDTIWGDEKEENALLVNKITTEEESI